MGCQRGSETLETRARAAHVLLTRPAQSRLLGIGFRRGKASQQLLVAESGHSSRASTLPTGRRFVEAVWPGNRVTEPGVGTYL